MKLTLTDLPEADDIEFYLKEIVLKRHLENRINEAATREWKNDTLEVEVIKTEIDYFFQCA